MVEFSLNKQCFQIPGLNYFPAGVYILNMEVRMFIVPRYDRFCISCVCMHAKLLQSCPTLFDCMDCSPPGSLSMGFSRREY